MSEEKENSAQAGSPDGDNSGQGAEKSEVLHNVTPLSGLYENWFLDYASYVILDRAVPHIHDGLKPVQRRIMHSLKEMDDGRFNKVANVIGNTMKYHPHGDASIGDAMVQLGQKNLLIDTQGNWGDPITGDSAAAARYIEGRLSKFAGEVVFNPQTTEWQLSYDGRNQEPLTLPVKFPLVLAQGADGIAVGLATKILPHNFIELIDASIESLKGNRPDILPDFPTGGIADFSKYNEGQRGGRVRVRARIQEKDKKTLVINEIPYGVTTGGLIDSIISANDKGKIKIKKIEDNTASGVEIVVHLAPGISPDVTIDALYAFTDCEVSISPNTCVIKKDKPHFMSVNDILVESTQYTKNLLKRELEIRLGELQEKIFFSSLLKIFIGEGMYKHPDYENAGSLDAVTLVLNRLFEPFFEQFYREILQEDYKKLIEKPMSSITRFDVKKADEQLKQLEEEMKEIRHHLRHLTEYAIAWFEKLKEKYGKGRERRTQIREFEAVQAAQVALANVKLYVNRSDGFVGTGLRKDEYLFDCSDLDDIIVFRADGRCVVTRVADKTFVGKNIVHAGIYKKGDERTVYNMIYRDGSSGKSYIKRFNVGGITRDKEYELAKGGKGSSLLYLTENPNGEAEVVTIFHKKMQRLRKLSFDADFAEVAIKGRSAQGNTLTKYPIRKIELKSKGISTLAGRRIWFDEIVQRLNADERGLYLGEFEGEDKIAVVYKNGSYELTGFDLSTHFGEGISLLEKFDPSKVYTAIHFDKKSDHHYVKRFRLDDLSPGRKVSFISEENGSKLVLISPSAAPLAEVEILKGKSKTPEVFQVSLAEFIDVKGLKAIGNRLSAQPIKSVRLLEEAPVAPAGTSSGNKDMPEQPGPAAPERTALDEDSATQAAEKAEAGRPGPSEKPEGPGEAEAPAGKPEALTGKPGTSLEKPNAVAEKSTTPAKPDAPAVKPETPEKPEVAKKPEKNVELEITNPDDVNITGKEDRQLGLF
ncbi:topoisomerase-4 subunit A [Anseongella ginsenosidimutans]|uniref:Topoisomerase-4 subunit A n=1 Tax=Anseongella ginsenosidimutans TaxID=496056 RepID=A0A4R3KX63_9SPHI|nr:DNA gyrase/topoisomerase IV subunit A [Anseongella ginsenosidimutans]QEC51075.1 DNA gyrase/topoisomerase IV subunit A [Anseongella ginsenosidimutans]TCS90265.1 topoisomerase-4 subunit A [Anseongella ginsenosidimutans]